MTRQATTILLALAGVIGVAAQVHAQGPSIAITELPAFGACDVVRGRVTGVDPAAHRVATYLYVDGLGWFSKPSCVPPTVEIEPNGSFTADVCTGGIDEVATIVCAALVETSAETPAIGCDGRGAVRIPAALDALRLAIDCADRYDRRLPAVRRPRTIDFAGWKWAVKEAPLPVGPGQVRFSSRPEDVFVDPDGHLHLRVAFHDGEWWATEVVLLGRPGFGTYSLQTASRVDQLPANVTFGAFTWDPYGDEDRPGVSPNREIDVEDSRWCEPDAAENTQSVVQPADVSGNRQRCSLPDLGVAPELTRRLTWRPDAVESIALAGEHEALGSPIDELIHRCEFTPASGFACNTGAKCAPASGFGFLHAVPTEGRAAFRLNLWPNNAEVPGCDLPLTAAEVVIAGFEFVPLADCLLDVDRDGQAAVGTDIVYIARQLLGLVPVPPSFRAQNSSIPPDVVVGGKIDALCPAAVPR